MPQELSSPSTEELLKVKTSVQAVLSWDLWKSCWYWRKGVSYQNIHEALYLSLDLRVFTLMSIHWKPLTSPILSQIYYNTHTGLQRNPISTIDSRKENKYIVFLRYLQLAAIFGENLELILHCFFVYFIPKLWLEKMISVSLVDGSQGRSSCVLSFIDPFRGHLPQLSHCNCINVASGKYYAGLF